MRKLIYKIIFIILAFIICLSSIISNVHAEDKNFNTTQPDLKTQRDRLEQQIYNSSDQLEVVQSDLSENLQQVEKLDEAIEKANQELQQFEIAIEEIKTENEKVENELKIAQKEYNNQKDLLDNTLISAYEAGETQYLDVILKSKNIMEFLSNYFLVKELASYETDLVQEIGGRKEKIEITKAKLEKMQEQFSMLKEKQTKTTKILENTRVVRQNFIDKLSDEEKALEAQISEYNARFEEINNQILKDALNGIDSVYIGGELEWPVPGYTNITSKYGMRYHPILHYTKLHTGVDIGAPMGANFIAANDGIVTKAEYNNAYGNMVIIDHGGGVSTLYAHGSEILVKPGQAVKRKEPVLKVGSTGYSTGAHAHFEVRLNGTVTDPMPYITNGLVPSTQNKTNQSNNAD